MLTIDLGDSFNLPFIITDSGGKVIYKNSAAKRVLKKIRVSDIITRFFVNKDFCFDPSDENVGIKRIINDDSVYNTAFYFPHEFNGEYIWLWVFSLFLNDLNYPDKKELMLFRDMFGELMAIMLKSKSRHREVYENNPRFNEALFRLMRSITISLNDVHRFRVYSTITTICEMTKRISDSYCMKVSYDTSFLDPNNFTAISFDRFANLFMHTFLTALKIADNSPVELSFSQFDDSLTTTVYLMVNIPEGTEDYGESLKPLFTVFSDNYINLLLLDKLVQFYNYQISYFIERRNGNCFLQLKIFCKASEISPVVMEANPAAEAMLMTIARNNYTVKIKELLKTI